MKKLILLALLFVPATVHAAPPLRDSLGAALVDGTDRYNAGDVDGCRTAYRTALESARVQLTSRGDLLLAVDDALKSDDPFVLREAIDMVRQSLKPVAVQAPATPTLKQETISKSCQCQQLGEPSCLCLPKGMACHCTPTHAHEFSSVRYRWKVIDATWAALIDGKTGKQVGGYLFDLKLFQIVTDGVDGEICEPPIQPPAKPVSVSVPVRTMPIRSATVCTT